MRRVSCGKSVIAKWPFGKSIFGVSLSLAIGIAPAVPAEAQSWLPSWSKLTGKKSAAATAPTATAVAPNPYAPATYQPSPYAQPSYAQPTYVQPSYGQPSYGQPADRPVAQLASAPYTSVPAGPNLAGPNGAMTNGGGPALQMAAAPTGYQGVAIGPTSPPQIDLGTPTVQAVPVAPVPTSTPMTTPIPTPTPAPTLVTPMPSSTMPSSMMSAPPPVTVAPRAPAVPAYTPSAPQAYGQPTYAQPGYAPQTNTAPMPPQPMTGPGVAWAPRLPPVGMPGYAGPRPGVDYGANAGPSGGAVFDPAAAQMQPNYAAPNYGQPSYGQPTGQPEYAVSPYGQTPGVSPYGPSYAGPAACGPASSYPPFCGSPGDISCCAPQPRFWENLTGFYEYSAFKGPLDLDGLNGNFGSRAGLFGSVPVYAPLGIAAQLGGSYGWYDWKGSQYTGDDERNQNFITAGLFRRAACRGFNFGAVYDWLLDDYYSDFHFEQVRAAASYSLSPTNEFGVWAAIPTRKDSATVGTPPVNNTFAPVLQGNAYWRKVWTDRASTTTFLGWCEEPNDFSYGSSAQFALNDFLAVNGGFQYIWPGSGSNTGREEEIWTVSFGLVFYPGTALTAATSSLRPLLAMPDNGNFAIRRY